MEVFIHLISGFQLKVGRYVLVYDFLTNSAIRMCANQKGKRIVCRQNFPFLLCDCVCPHNLRVTAIWSAALGDFARK